MYFFFFQAEDGIRDLTVTGVQTCALPILGLQPRDRPRGGAAGIRRDPVRLRALSDRRAAQRGAVLEAELEGDPAAHDRRVPRARAPRAWRDGRLRRRRRLRLHGVQRERHGHRPAHRGADAAPRLHLADGLPVGLPARDPELSQPRRAPLRGGVRDGAADPEALGPHPRAGAAVAAGLPRLRVRPSSLRRAGDPRADQSRGRRRRPRLDALEPAQRLHQRRAQAAGGPRGQVRLLLVVALILTAALLVASFAGAEPLPPNELGRVMILEYHKIDYPEARRTRTPENFRRDLETVVSEYSAEPVPSPLRLLLVTLAEWVNRHQQEVIEYLVEENRVLREQLKGR